MKNKRLAAFAIVLLTLAVFVFTACTDEELYILTSLLYTDEWEEEEFYYEETETPYTTAKPTASPTPSPTAEPTPSPTPSPTVEPTPEANFCAESVPEYESDPWVAVNGNVPFFTEREIALAAESFETYSELDELGRCGPAVASIGVDLMPTEDRESIGNVKPTGWQTIKYDCVDGKYLYNRCHLIGYQLTAENANRKNLITGTRYLNIKGMLSFENMAADYIRETGNHVLYRVTPIFKENELLARGVLMEAYSVEDEGEGVMFCVYAYNVQPGIEIDYTNGESREEGLDG